MALTGKVETEIDIKSPAEKFYHVFRRAAHQVPNICPETIPGVDLHEGDWDASGSVKSWNYVVGGNVETVKETVESVDDANKTIVFKTLGGEITQDYKDFKTILHVIGKGKVGVAKWSLEYEKLNASVPDPTKYLDVTISMTRAIDEHLLKA